MQVHLQPHPTTRTKLRDNGRNTSRSREECKMVANLIDCWLTIGADSNSENVSRQVSLRPIWSCRFLMFLRDRTPCHNKQICYPKDVHLHVNPGFSPDLNTLNRIPRLMFLHWSYLYHSSRHQSRPPGARG